MPRRRLLLLLVLVSSGLLVAILSLVPPCADSPSGGGRTLHGDGRHLLRLRGRLVDSETGAGRAGVWVMALPERSWADDTETIEQFRQMNEEWREEGRRGEAHGDPPVVTGKDSILAADITHDDGRFEMIVTVPWSVGIVDGKRLPSTLPTSRSGTQALLVRVAGREPVVIDLATDSGVWTEHPPGKDWLHALWATWDLGDIEVAVRD